MAFDLSSISRTKRMRAPKIVIAGPGKIGKTTFASMAPNAIGILTEDGADAVDASAFPLATSLDQVYEAIGTLLQQEHDYQTVFLDSLDWLEPLIHAHVCKANKWASIEAAGYGKGYIAAADEWRTLLKSKGLRYVENSMDDAGVRQAFEFAYPDLRQMPQIFINDQRVGGLAGLQAALKQLEGQA